MKNRYEQFKQNDYSADDAVTNQNTDQSTDQNTDVNMNPGIGRDGKFKRIAFMVFGVIFAGAIVTGCSLLKSDGKKSIPEPIKKVANAIGISTDDYEMGSYGAGNGSQWEEFHIYKVDPDCYVVESDDFKTNNEYPSGGGTVSGAGTLSTREPDKYLTLIPKASAGYEYMGASIVYDKSDLFVKPGVKCIVVSVGNTKKPTVPGYSSSEVYWVSGLKESPTIRFFFKKTKHRVTLAVSPQCADIHTIQNDFNDTDLPSGGSKVIVGIYSSPGINKSLYFELVNAQDTVYDFTKGQIYEVDRNSGKLDRAFTTRISGANDYNYDGNTRWIKITLDEENSKYDHDYVVVFKVKEGKEAYDYPNQIITYPDPAEGGTTAGDTQSRGTISANIEATPNTGYRFSYWSWGENGNQITSEKNPLHVTSSGVNVYTAHFVPETYKISLADVTPSEGGTVEGLGVYKKGDPVKLTISPSSDDYVLREWYYTTEDGIKHSGSDTTVNIDGGMPGEDVFLHVVFDTTYVRLQTAVSPTAGGTAEIKTIPPIPKSNSATDSQFSKGTQSPEIKLEATPRTGYKFLYWSDNNGNQYSDNPLEISQLNQDVTYTASFGKDTVNVTIAASPGSVGGVKYKIDTGAESDMGDSFDVTVNDGSRLQMTAIEHDTSYKFDHWEMIESGKDPQVLSKDMVYSIASYKAPTSGAHVRYVAVFEPLQFKVEAESDPIDPGIVVTINGDSTGHVYVNADEYVNLSVNNLSTEYKFEYWSDQDGHLYRGTDVTVYGVKKDMKFIAHFVKSASNVTIRTVPAGSGKFEYNINSLGATGALAYEDVLLADGDNVVITAIEDNPAYIFDHWELVEMGKDPQTIGTNLIYTITSFKAPADEKAVGYVAVFKPALCKVEATVSGDGGKVQINGNDVTQINVEKGSDAELTAVPWDEYKFDHWVDQDGNTFTDNPIKLTSIQKNMKYTAYFKKTTAKITISTIPAGVGLVKYNDSDYAELFEIDALTDDDLIMTAKEMNLLYKFDHWEIVEPGQPNKTTTVNPLSVIDLIPPTSGQLRYIAVFVPRLFTIKVEANPTEGGTVLIDERYTETGVEGGSDVTLKSYANEGYYLDYWQDSKGNRFSGQYSYADGVETNTLTISGITADETYTAVFVKGLVKINYLTAPYGVGKVDCNGYGYEYYGECDAAGGWQITLTARADNPKEYVFDYWEDNFGNKYSGNPLEISNIRKSTTFTAVFKKYSKEDAGGIIVYASPAAGGFVSKVYNDDDTATITARENSGYTFVCWKKGKTVISNRREAIVDDLTDGTIYVAYFVKEDGSVIRTSVVDEHFYNEKRHITSPTYSVTKQSMTFLAQAQIALDKARNDTPAPKKYAAFEKAAEYYENHLIEDDFVFADGELVTTKGEKMPIDYIPTDEEAFLDDAYEFTLKKFGDRYGTEILAAVDVTMPNEYESGTRTYLWRNTGGAFKDNVYLLYARNYNSEYEWCAGVVDIDESIRFTISDPGSIVRLAAVRVKIGESDEKE